MLSPVLNSSVSIQQVFSLVRCYSALVSKINLPSCELFAYNFKFSIATVQITLRLQLKKRFVLSCECGSLVDWPSLSCF